MDAAGLPPGVPLFDELAPLVEWAELAASEPEEIEELDIEF